MSNPSWRHVLFFSPSGPMMHYARGVLTISDLNPEIETRWALTRPEMLCIGWRFIKAAIIESMHS